MNPDCGIDDSATTEWAESEANCPHVPTIVVVDIPYSSYGSFASSGPRPTFDEWSALPNFMRIPFIEWISEEIPMDWISGTFSAERCIDVAMAIEGLGIPDLAIRLRVKDGELPPSDDPTDQELLWWSSTITPYFKSGTRP